MRYDLTEAAAATAPVTVEEAKAWLDLDHAADDAMISDLIDALTARVEEETGLALSNRSFTYSAQASGQKLIDSIRLPRRPVTSVTSVTLYDDEGASEALTVDEDFWVLGETVRVNRQVLLPGERVEVVFTAGYASSDAVPAPIKQAIKRAAKDHYEIPGNVVVGLMVSRLPQPALEMLQPYRRVRV